MAYCRLSGLTNQVRLLRGTVGIEPFDLAYAVVLTDT